MEYVIGVDLGGTKIDAGLVKPNGRIKDIVRVDTEAKKGADKVTLNIIKAIRSVINNRVKAIGIGSPGPLDYKKGVILNPPNLPFRNFNLKRIIEKEFKLKVKIDNANV